MSKAIRRKSQVIAVAVAVSMLLVGVAPAAASERRKLPEPIEFEGVPCKQYAWFHEDGGLSQCRLARDTVINGQELPEGTTVGFARAGVMDCVFLPGDTEIQGHLYRGHGHDYQTCFHSNGRLSFGNLAGPETIQGVPCRKSTFWTWVLVGNAGVQFHENGALKGCLLDSRFEQEGKSLERGERIELDADGRLVSKGTSTR